jgi:hypothetical protein
MISESFCYSRVLRTTASENPNLVNQASHQTNRAITQRSDGESGGYPPAGERGRGRGHRDPPSTDLHARRRGATDQQPHQADKDTRATTSKTLARNAKNLQRTSKKPAKRNLKITNGILHSSTQQQPQRGPNFIIRWRRCARR